MRNFTFDLKWREILRAYPVEIRQEVYEAVIEYAASGIIVEMQPLCRMAFDFIRYEIDAREQRKAERLAKRQAAKAVRELDRTEDPRIEKIADEFMASDRAPGPVIVTSSQTGAKMTVTKKHIKRVVIRTLENFKETGGLSYYTDNDFMDSLRKNVGLRLYNMCSMLESVQDIKSLSDTQWECMLNSFRRVNSQ